MPMRYALRTLVDGMSHLRWSLDLLRHSMPQFANFASEDVHGPELQAELTSRQMDASFAWDDLKWLRDLWTQTLLIKGISRPDDAVRCIALIPPLPAKLRPGSMSSTRSPIKELPRVDIRGSWIDFVVQSDKPFFIEPLSSRRASIVAWAAHADRLRRASRNASGAARACLATARRPPGSTRSSPSSRASKTPARSRGADEAHSPRRSMARGV
jgi:FMN-dependent dehydrogenase/Malonate decarboxylase, alpha subunit, transporter